MSTAAEAVRLTYPDYLALEELGPEKRAWVKGELFAMSGGTFAHNRVSGNAYGELYVALRGRPCAPANSDQRVRVDAADASFYPDVTVFCGGPRFSELDPHALVNPVVLIEVLSPSTEAYDRGGKLEAYVQLESLQHYLLLHQDRARAELYTRNGDGTWTWRVVEGAGVVELPAIDARLALEAVYAGVLG